MGDPTEGNRWHIPPHPVSPLEWNMYWSWWKFHYPGVKQWCEQMKHRQRHAFTHMGLEDA
jgi:hypothetical protein